MNPLHDMEVSNTTELGIVHNYTANHDDILDDLNKAKVVELMPAIVVISCLMVFGLIGNTSVLLFFRRKSRKDTATFFIITLAVVDLIVCLAISLTIAELTSVYSFKSDIGCKLYVFSKFFTTFFSALILLAIAAYRYRKICRPFKRQLSLKGAKITVGCNIILSLILSVPQLFLFGTVSGHLENNENVTVIGYDCGMKVYQDRLTVFNAFMSYSYTAVFVVSFSALIIMYSLQGKAISKFNKDHLMLKLDGRLSKLSKSQSLDTDIHSSVTFDLSRKNEHTEENVSKEAVLLKKISKLQPQDSESTEVVIRNRTQNQPNRQEKHLSVHISNAKITIMFLIITLCFMCSFIPYLSYSLWRSFTVENTDAFNRETIPVQICLNSYLINSVVNPIVYGLFHVEFRQYVKRSICKCFRKKQIQIQQ